MIDLAVLKGSSFVVLGLARSGLATVRALQAAGIDCVAWDDNAASREAAADDRRSGRRAGGHRLVARDGPYHQSRHSESSAPAASRRRGGARGRQEDHLRHRAAGPRPAEGGFRRHHRHQRQVDDHGPDRPYPRRGRPALRGRRQYRPRRARSRAARRRVVSMCWSSRPTSSNCSTASAPMSRSGSTSRPTISTGTATWRAMSRPRRTSSRASGPATAP